MMCLLYFGIIFGGVFPNMFGSRLLLRGCGSCYMSIGGLLNRIVFACMI